MPDDLDRDRLQRPLGRAARRARRRRPSPGGCCATTAWPCRSPPRSGERMVKLRRGRRAAHRRRLAGARRRDGASACSTGRRCCAAGRRAATTSSCSPPTSTSCCSSAGSTGPSPPVASSAARRWRGTPAPTRSWCSPRPTWPTTSTAPSPTVDDEHPGLERLVTSSADRARHRRRCGSAWPAHTSVMLGESGAGKSRLVNAVLGSDAAVVGAVRAGDAQGPAHHHEPPAPPAARRRRGDRLARASARWAWPATRSRSTPPSPTSTSSARSATSPTAATPASPAAPSRWRSRPGSCRADRLAAYQELRKEAASAARRADEHARRTYERGFTKAVKAHVQQKPSNRQ